MKRIFSDFMSFKVIIHCNKASIPELQNFAEISDIDGASNFAPKITAKKTDFLTRILNLLQASLYGGKTAAPSGRYFWNVDSNVLLVEVWCAQKNCS